MSPTLINEGAKPTREKQACQARGFIFHFFGATKKKKKKDNLKESNVSLCNNPKTEVGMVTGDPARPN